MAQKYLLIVLISLIILLYCQYYCSYKPDFKITQTYLDKIDMNMLQERYPIVLYDKVIEPRQLLKTLFAYTYALSNEQPIMFNGKIMINLSKYVIIYNQLTDIDIDIIHPRYRNTLKFEQHASQNRLVVSKDDIAQTKVEYVTIKLKKNQVLILPCFWLFTCSLPLQTIFIDDVLSYLISIIYRKMLI
jgi:hypothetical protein